MTRRKTATPPGVVAVMHVPVDDLTPHPANPRQGDVGAIVESIERNGWWGVIVAQRSTGHVLAGNHRLQAARHLGMTTVPVHYLDVDDATALRVLLADNRANDRATYNDDQLAQLLQSIMDDAGTLDGTLYDGDDLDQLLADITTLPPGAPASDDAPPVPADPKTRPGDVFDLGPHRLVCGDATDPAVWATAMLGFPAAQMIATDPPYGMNLQVGRGKRGVRRNGIANDDANAPAVTRDALALGLANADDLATAIVFGPGGQNLCLLASLLDATQAAGWKHQNTIVWDKAYPGRGVTWRLSWEAAMEFRRGEKARWLYGLDKRNVLSGYLTGSYAQASEPLAWEHPTPKPAKLMADLVGAHAEPNAVVVDPFAGGGATLIGADTIGRRCVAIELDPAYCDVIRQRYADHANRPDLAP